MERSRPPGIRRRWLGALTATAVAMGLVIAAPSVSNANLMRDGYTLYGDATTASLPQYTIRLTSTQYESELRAGLAVAIDQIEAATSTRITVAAGRVSPTAEPSTGEIFIRIAASGWGTCIIDTDGDGEQDQPWTGCTSTRTSSSGGFTYRAQSVIRFTPNTFAWSLAFERGMIAHELGHSLGLAHETRDSSQLMYSTETGMAVNYSPDGRYRPGDIRGLQYLARGSSAPVGEARANIGLGAVSNDRVFYADGSGVLRNTWWTAADGWRDTRLNASGIRVREGSPVVATPAGDQVFFISTENRIANAFYTNGAWNSAHLSNSTVTVQAGSDLAVTSGKVYFIRSNGDLYNAYYQGGSWLYGGLSDTVQPRQGSALAVNEASTQVYFVSTQNRIANAFYTNGAWNSAHLSGNDLSVASGSSVVRAGGHVFFVNADDQVAHAAYSNGAWVFHTIGGWPAN